MQTPSLTRQQNVEEWLCTNPSDSSADRSAAVAPYSKMNGTARPGSLNLQQESMTSPQVAPVPGQRSAGRLIAGDHQINFTFYVKIADTRALILHVLSFAFKTSAKVQNSFHYIILFGKCEVRLGQPGGSNRGFSVRVTSHRSDKFINVFLKACRLNKAAVEVV